MVHKQREMTACPSFVAFMFFSGWRITCQEIPFSNLLQKPKGLYHTLQARKVFQNAGHIPHPTLTLVIKTKMEKT